MSVIVSLSTIPSRFEDLSPTLHCLLNQTAKIDEIRLYIAKRYRRFPEYDGQLPQVPKGVRIITVEDDLGPASKVLFAADDLRGTDTTIIYCDDDMHYEPDRFERMIACHKDGHSDHCVTSAGFDLEYLRLGSDDRTKRQPRPRKFKKTNAYRKKRIKHLWRQLLALQSIPKPPKPRFDRGGYVDVAEGYGGVLVKPHFFDEHFYNIPDVIWSVDDIWISGHLERRGIPIWLAPSFISPARLDNHDNDPLGLAVIEGANRDQANAACIKYMKDTYGIWL